ncbi:fibrinogen-like YCDxxxxGGGW domain-containing protein [Nannocystaceae bacterium ST9]
MRSRPVLTLCLLATTPLLPACGGDDADSGDEIGDTSTSATGSETGDGDTNTETSGTADSTDDATMTTETTADTSTDDATTETTADTSTTADSSTDSSEGGGVCGNSIIEPGEQCDDGNLSDEDGCLSSCVESSCGDGFVNMGVEACDDGINDGSYGGCAINCASLGPYCGDGQVDAMQEDCDDANIDLTDGCQDNCVVPASCLTLIEYDDSLADGDYQIVPPGYGGDPIPVWCDMTSDGGGYTFLKVDANGVQVNAAQAEAECANYGMQLWIPRSQAHKDVGWTVANDANIGEGSNPDYMRILGIYPNFNGATCASQAMNSSNAGCGWDASDDGPWFVHSVNNISEPNGDNTTTGSMYYQWQGNGQIQWHNDIGGAGYTSAFYMCDVADKLP